MKRLSVIKVLLGPAVLLLLPLLSCSLLDTSGKLEFREVGALQINYSATDTNVVPMTLLVAGGGPNGGYTWSLASGSQYPSGTTVDALTGVFHATGGNVALQSGTFKMKVSAGSNSATGTYIVTVRNWGSGPSPWAVLQQYDPYTVDPSALELPDAKAGKDYGASLFCMGGKPPYRWSEDLSYTSGTDLSTVGLLVHNTNGIVWGQPFASASGTKVKFRIIVTDADGDVAAYQPVYTINIK